MKKLFNRADTGTAKKTIALFREEMAHDSRSVWLYATLIPLQRLLYVVLLPFVFSFIIQALITNPDDWQHPAMLVGVATIISIGAIVTGHIGIKRLFLHQERLRTSLTGRAIDHLMRQGDQFFANRKVGTLAGDINTFSGSIITLLDIVMLHASTIAINFAASLIIIGFMSPILLVPLGLVTGLLVWRSLVGTAKRGPIRHRRKVLSSQLNGLVADILSNQSIVRDFAASDREATRVVESRVEIETIAQDEIEVLQRESSLRQATLFGFQIVTMGVCIWLFSTGGVSIAALIFAVTYLGRLTGSLFDISPLIRNTEQVFLDAANITEILDVQPEVIDRSGAHELQVRGGGMTLDGISFYYGDNQSQAVINKLSLTIKPGESIGLAGHSGGGKTTLSKLLLRFADVTDGAISIDGQNIADVTQESLRATIAYVPQEPYLFHRSLRDNIAYGNPGATDVQIMHAVTQANADDFINQMPEGLDTIVGERGVKLSGGQRQRIAIARAILKDAPVLILDEATSALDSESEGLIQEALEKLMKGRTSIVIAHRLSTIAKLDRIIVLKAGQISEQGTHRQLLERGGTYAALWSRQSGGFIDES